MKIRFTDRAIAALPPPPLGKKDHWFSALQMEHALVRRTLASRIFYYQSRDGNGATFRKKIGKFPGVNVAQFFKDIKVLDGRLAAGEDLRAEKATRKAKLDQTRADAGYTFDDLISDWEAVPNSKRRPSYVKGTADGLRRAYAHLLDQPAASITLGQSEEVWESLTDLPAAANAAAERARTLCRWGVKTKRLSTDPTQGVDLPEKPEKRTHSPTGDEARKIWAAASTLGAPDGPAIKLLQVSVLRLREAIGALRPEFSEGYSKFSPSPERMKMGKPHIVWLPPVVRKMLAELPQFEGSDLVFSRDGRRPLTGFSGLKKRLDKALAGSGVRPFRFHDLRRSVVTWMAENGVSSIVADRLLAHTSLKDISPTASIYNVYEFAAERKAALELWVAFLEGGREAETNPSSNSPLLLPAPPQQLLPPPPLTTNQERAHRDQVAESFGNIQWGNPKRAERYVTLLLTIAADQRVHAVITKIYASELTPAFKKKHPVKSNEAAVQALIYCAAESAFHGATVRKRNEVVTWKTKWEERTHKALGAAELSRSDEQEALARGDEDAASRARAAASEFDNEAATADQMRQAYITTNDPRCVEHRSGGAGHPSSRVKGVLLDLMEFNKETFGSEHGDWAADVASAAVGWEVSRYQGRRRR